MLEAPTVQALGAFLSFLVGGEIQVRRPSVYVLFAAALLITSNAAAEDLPIDRDAVYTVRGLAEPAEIIVDQWGIPHIYALDHYDAFFVQGFNAARDRLWQIDLWRRRGLGTLSEVLGTEYVAQDKAARMFLYRGDMYAEWLAYGNDAKRIAQAFTAGINAFVDLTREIPGLLPPEFELLGYEPAHWQTDDVVRIRSNGLWRNVNTEVWRARLACNDRLELAAKWKQLEPPWQATIPDGLDPCVIPGDVLKNYRLAKAPVTFTGNPQLAMALQDELNHGLGSNNWVVAPARTRTGRPILADDPHRGHATPSLRYIAHLVAPGLNVIGAGEPALPGISIGHNERIAFGLTIFPIDQEDLYVFAKAAGGYRYQDRIEPFVLHREKITIADATAQTATLKFTRHGPVVAETDSHAFAVRAAWLEPGMSPYFGSIEYMRAENFREFVGALNRWGAPSENQVYADIDGNIGYKPAGRFPVRRTWDGLMPVPGDGRYEWQGYFDMDTLPEEYNPERGFTGTANSMNLPDDYPVDRYRVGFEWSSPWRYKRLWEVLSEDAQHDVNASLALQRDNHSVFARQVIGALPELQHSASGLLHDWNFDMSVDSAAAALWNVWYRDHLPQALARLLTGDQPRPEGTLDSLTVIDLLKTRQGRKAALQSLQGAVDQTIAQLGADTSQWRWGDLHRARFSHPLAELAPTALKEQMRMLDYPIGGNANSTNSARYGRDSWDVVAGPSFRMVVDVGNWDAALATNTPGQSGDPRSRFYDNLLRNWATGSQFPLLYSKKAVQQHRAFTISLQPKRVPEAGGVVSAQ